MWMIGDLDFRIKALRKLPSQAGTSTVEILA